MGIGVGRKISCIDFAAIDMTSIENISIMDIRMLSVKEIIVSVAKALSANRAPSPPLRYPTTVASPANPTQAVNSNKPDVPSSKVPSNQEEWAFYG